MGDSGGSLWSKRGRVRQPWWTSLPDDDLLQMRLKDLGVSIEGTWLHGCVRTLNGELRRRGLLQAHAWISDEWFSPDTTPGIAVPFYLAHPRLARLERKMFLDVEGEHPQRMHEDPASRGRPYHAACLRAEPPPQVAGHVRPVLDQVSPALSPQSGKQGLRPAPAALVCAEPSGRRLRRDVRSVADAAVELAQALCRLAGAREARICRRADGRDGRRIPCPHQARQKSILFTASPGRWASTIRKSSTTIRSTPTPVTTATCSAFSPASPDMRTQWRRPPSSARNRAQIREAASRWSGGYQVALDAILDQMIDRCRALKLRAPGSRAGNATGAGQAAHHEDRVLALPILAAAVVRRMKSLRILALAHPDLIPPENPDDVQRSRKLCLEDGVRRPLHPARQRT